MIGTIAKIVREATQAAWAARVFSAVGVLIVAGSLVAVLLTSGQVAAAEQRVLASFDDEQTRTIIISLGKQGGRLSTRDVDSLASLDTTETVLGVGSTSDYWAAANPAGPKIGVREVYGFHNGKPLHPTGGALVSRQAAQTLRMPPGIGSLATTDREDVIIAGTIDAASYLADMEPLALVALPETASDDLPGQPVRRIIVVCSSTAGVGIVSDVAKRIVDHNPPGTVSVSTSKDMATLNTAISGTLSQNSHNTVLMVLGAAALGIAVNAWGLTLARRRDLGRRRALGATRALVVILIVGQSTITAVAGVAMGVAGVVPWFLWRGLGVAPPTYIASVAVLLVLAAAVAALLPAVFASLRDPVAELRVP